MATKKTAAQKNPGAANEPIRDAISRARREKQRSSPKAVPPPVDLLLKDLALLRRSGITHLRGLKLDALTRAVRIVEEASPNDTYLPQSIEELLRRAVDRMDDGRYAISAELLFGLAQGTRGSSPTDLRKEAADRLNIAVETFRKDHEKTTLSELAESIIGLCRDQEMRTARVAMADKRHPADSRLAIGWAERFEDYYRVWTCVYALAADLTAYRMTMLEPDRPWDNHDEPGRLIAPLSTETESYTQEYQAEGYIRFAIYRFASFLAEMHRFQIKRGGFWLLSDAEVEVKVSDALYRIGWHTPNNERDDSWMRMSMMQAGGELHVFQDLLMRTTIGAATHEEWQEWAANCHCTWNDESEDDRSSHFPTADTDDGVAEECGLHQVVKACCDYIELIDADWMAIADWYRLDTPPGRGVTAEGLYRHNPKS
jgi:hypothetical protein